MIEYPSWRASPAAPEVYLAGQQPTHLDRATLLMGVSVPPAVPHTPGSWRLLYFDAPNRGEQVRQLFALSKTPFVDLFGIQ